MAGITERNRQKMDLVGIGYSSSYIDEWHPKITLYRHKASYNQSGLLAEDVGSTINGVPGNPDYILRKSAIGLFTWPPSSTCVCKWCSVREEEPVMVHTSAAVEKRPAPANGNRRVGPHYKS